MSNDTWLIAGGDAAAAQHFSMSVFRAVETRRYLVRAATAGISGFVDPLGRPYHLSAEREGVVLGEISPRQEMTVYARSGDWFAVSCLGLALWTLRDTRRRV
jgi:apolipoprotein N-acyltransferase